MNDTESDKRAPVIPAASVSHLPEVGIMSHSDQPPIVEIPQATDSLD